MIDPLIIVSLIARIAEAFVRHSQGNSTEQDRQLLKNAETLSREDLARATGHEADLGGEG